MTEVRIYRGLYANEKPTQKQVELLRQQGVMEEIIRNCDRFSAFLIIKKNMQRFYSTRVKARRKRML